MRSLLSFAMMFLVLTPQARAEEPGTAAHFVRACLIYAEPSLKASKVCQKRPGDKINYSDSAPGGFVQVEMDDCAGYTPDTCVAGPMVTEKTGVRRDPPHRRYLFRMGLSTSLDGTLGSVTGASEVSRGDGWNVAVRFDIALTSRFYLAVIPQYQVLGLSRSLSTTGGPLADKDAEDVKFTQSVSYYGGQLLFGIVVHRKYFDSNPITEPEITLEGGFQYLKPLSGRNTPPSGSTSAFTPTDSPLLFVVGPVVDLCFSRSFQTLLHGQFFYNIGGSGGSKFFGGRIGIALMAGLL